MMKFKRFVYVGLVLVGGLFGYCIAWRHYVGSFARRLHPPGAEQVRKWAGLSESGHLAMTTLTNVASDVDVGLFGKFEWLWSYENRRRSSTNYVVIAVYKPGAFLPTNRTKFIDTFEQVNKGAIVSTNFSTNSEVRKGEEEFKRLTAQVTMPNGEKSYGFILGLDPARFALHRRFDVMLCEYIDPESYDVRYAPAEEVEWPGAQRFYELFTNVDAFLRSQ